MIKFYRIVNSFIRQAQVPFFATTTCKYYPSCSEYGEMALREHGKLKGSLKTIWRIMRCNPFSSGGIDFPTKTT